MRVAVPVPGEAFQPDCSCEYSLIGDLRCHRAAAKVN